MIYLLITLNPNFASSFGPGAAGSPLFHPKMAAIDGKYHRLVLP